MKYLRQIIILIAVLLSAVCAGASVVVPDSLRRVLDRSGRTPVEGVWRFAADGAVMAVTTDGAGGYRVTALDSPDTRLAPMTVIGTASPESAYSCRWNVATDTDRDGRPCSVHAFSAVVDKDNSGELTLEPASRLAKLRLWVLYRFFINVSVHSRENSRKLTAHRIYPPDPDNSLTPLIL